jgi:hypothetical protein
MVAATPIRPTKADVSRPAQVTGPKINRLIAEK